MFSHLGEPDKYIYCTVLHFLCYLKPLCVVCVPQFFILSRNKNSPRFEQLFLLIQRETDRLPHSPTAHTQQLCSVICELSGCKDRSPLFQVSQWPVKMYSVLLNVSVALSEFIPHIFKNTLLLLLLEHTCISLWSSLLCSVHCFVVLLWSTPVSIDPPYLQQQAALFSETVLIKPLDATWPALNRRQTKQQIAGEHNGAFSG